MILDCSMADLGRAFILRLAANHAMQPRRTCKVSQIDNQFSRPADRRRSPSTPICRLSTNDAHSQTRSPSDLLFRGCICSRNGGRTCWVHLRGDQRDRPLGVLPPIQASPSDRCSLRNRLPASLGDYVCRVSCYRGRHSFRPDYLAF